MKCDIILLPLAHCLTPGSLTIKHVAPTGTMSLKVSQNVGKKRGFPGYQQITELDSEANLYVC